MSRFTVNLKFEITARSDFDKIVRLWKDKAGTIPLGWGTYAAFYCGLKLSLDDAAELFPFTVSGSLLDSAGGAAVADDGWYRWQADRTLTEAIQVPAKATVGDFLNSVFDLFGQDVSGEHVFLARGRALLYPAATENMPA